MRRAGISLQASPYPNDPPKLNVSCGLGRVVYAMTCPASTMRFPTGRSASVVRLDSWGGTGWVDCCKPVRVCNWMGMALLYSHSAISRLADWPMMVDLGKGEMRGRNEL